MTVPDLDPALQISPYRLFRMLVEGETPILVDLRPSPTETLDGARPVAELDAVLQGESEPVILFDEDGVEAVARAHRLQAAGHRGVRALYGGLELYRFALDPKVVGEERFLRSKVTREDGGESDG